VSRKARQVMRLRTASATCMICPGANLGVSAKV
jgi:hypothetical protein